MLFPLRDGRLSEMNSGLGIPDKYLRYLEHDNEVFVSFTLRIVYGVEGSCGRFSLGL